MLSAAAVTTDDLMDPDRFVSRGYPHAAWAAAAARGADLLVRVRRRLHRRFWAVTKHADIVRISRQPRSSCTTARASRSSRRASRRSERSRAPPAQHGSARARRRTASSRATASRRARSQSLRPEIERIARDLLDELCAEGPRARSTSSSASRRRCRSPCSRDLLGVPRADWQMLFRWTNQTDRLRRPRVPGRRRDGRETADERAHRSSSSTSRSMAEERGARAARRHHQRARQRAHRGGSRVPPFELLSYYFLLVDRGQRDHAQRDERRAARADREPRRAREAARATRAGETRGRGDRALDDAGDPVLPHAARRLRDARPEDPRGRVAVPVLPVGEPRRGGVRRALRRSASTATRTRTSRFGIGEHFCLGANLARLELRVVFARARARASTRVELAGAGRARCARASSAA